MKQKCPSNSKRAAPTRCVCVCVECAADAPCTKYFRKRVASFKLLRMLKKTKTERVVGAEPVGGEVEVGSPP